MKFAGRVFEIPDLEGPLETKCLTLHLRTQNLHFFHPKLFEIHTKTLGTFIRVANWQVLCNCFDFLALPLS